MKLNSSFILYSEFLCDFQIIYHFFELFERYQPITIFVSLDNGSVHQLLKLSISKVVSYHYFENFKKISIGNESILVNVINFKSEFQFLSFISSRGEGCKSVDEFHKGNLSVFIFVKNLNHSLHQRILSYCWNIKKFFRLQLSTLVFVQFVEMLVKSLYFALRENVWIVYSLNVSH